MPIISFVKGNPALVPLFVAVGTGIGGAFVFAGHYLKNNQDVIINKAKYPEPWNNVAQNKNTKFFSWNPDFWTSRVGVQDPRRAFIEDLENKPESQLDNREKAVVERAKDIRRKYRTPSKEDAAGHL